MNTFGEYIRTKRLKQDLSLREFCRIFGLDIANLSRLENNREKPSLREDKLEQLARALGIEKNTKEWIIFTDLAHQANKKLPVDIGNNTSEIMTLLPAFLRTKDNKQISNKQVEKLIKFLKNQH